MVFFNAIATGAYYKIKIMEIIEGVTINQDGRIYKLPRPSRHHDLIRMIADTGGKIPVTGEQGFYSNKRRFIDRKEAKIVALKTVKKLLSEGKYDLEELYSECLW